MFSPLQRLAALPNIIAVIIRLAFYSFFSLFVSLADTLTASVLTVLLASWLVLYCSFISSRFIADKILSLLNLLFP